MCFSVLKRQPKCFIQYDARNFSNGRIGYCYAVRTPNPIGKENNINFVSTTSIEFSRKVAIQTMIVVTTRCAIVFDRATGDREWQVEIEGTEVFSAVLQDETLYL
jgi:hypothetical protein